MNMKTREFGLLSGRKEVNILILRDMVSICLIDVEKKNVTFDFRVIKYVLRIITLTLEMIYRMKGRS